MNIRLVDIIGVSPSWETAHQVKALEINGKSKALEDILILQEKHPEDFNKLMTSIRMVAGQNRVHNENRVKRGRGENVSDIYEMKGGKSRLFFFYTPGKNEIVVCTHAYWKTKSSKKEQDEAFKVAARLRNIYLDGI